MDGFRGKCSERTWLMRIAVNTCRDYLKTSWLRHANQRLRDRLEGWYYDE